MAAGIAAGLAVQLVSADMIAAYVGDTALGVAIAATLGILIVFPTMAEVLVVVVLLALGIGVAPAAILLCSPEHLVARSPSEDSSVSSPRVELPW